MSAPATDPLTPNRCSPYGRVVAPATGGGGSRGPGDVGAQASFDDLGTPLHEVTFCVIDLETTGGPAADGGITEVGAVRLRGGECLGTFQTLVNPGLSIPPQITVLTGITDAMVVPAPRIEPVLPALVEFVGDAVIVGHNVRYDLGFLNAALERHGRPRLRQPLGRHLRAGPPPGARRGAQLPARHPRRRASASPTSRRTAPSTTPWPPATCSTCCSSGPRGLGVLGLDDLLALPTMAGHPQAAKLRLTQRPPPRPRRLPVPRPAAAGCSTSARPPTCAPGCARTSPATTAGRSASCSARSRPSTPSSAPAPSRPRCSSCASSAASTPASTARAGPGAGGRWVRLTAERFPRLSVVRTVRDDGADYLGPFAAHRAARRVVEAIHTAAAAAPLPRGAGPAEPPPCAAAQLGRAPCPCAGDLDPAVVRAGRRRGARRVAARPDLLLSPLADRMDRLAAAERFEEAADVRDRAAALVGRAAPPAPRRGAAGQRSDRAGPPGRCGRGAGRRPAHLGLGARRAGPVHRPGGRRAPPRRRGPGSRASDALAAELLCVAAWLDRAAGTGPRVALASGGPGLALAGAARPSRPATAAGARPGPTATHSERRPPRAGPGSRAAGRRASLVRRRRAGRPVASARGRPAHPAAGDAGLGLATVARAARRRPARARALSSPQPGQPRRTHPGPDHLARGPHRRGPASTAASAAPSPWPGPPPPHRRQPPAGRDRPRPRGRGRGPRRPRRRHRPRCRRRPAGRHQAALGARVGRDRAAGLPAVGRGGPGPGPPAGGRVSPPPSTAWPSSSTPSRRPAQEVTRLEADAGIDRASPYRRAPMAARRPRPTHRRPPRCDPRSGRGARRRLRGRRCGPRPTW